MEKEIKRRLGDRTDGYRIRNLSATSVGAMGFMRSRVEAQVLSTFEADLTKTEEFIKHHREDLKGLSVQTIIFAALVRAYGKYPRCKRFIIGRKMYCSNKIRINIMVKPKYDIEEEEILVPIVFDGSETLPQVIEKYNTALAYRLEENERKKQANNGKMNPAVWINNNLEMIAARLSGLVMFLDRHNFIPASFFEISPFHGTIFVTNGGSIGLHQVAHHLYEFGTVSMFMGIGSKMKKLVPMHDEIVKKTFIHLSCTVDERICEGYYWASTMRIVRRMIENPDHLMLSPIEEKQINANSELH